MTNICEITFLVDLPDKKRILELIKHQHRRNDATESIFFMFSSYSRSPFVIYQSFALQFIGFFAASIVEQISFFAFAFIAFTKKLAWINQDDNVNWIKLIYELQSVFVEFSLNKNLNSRARPWRSKEKFFNWFSA